MGQLRYRTKINLGVAGTTILVGLFFLYQAMSIESYSGDSVGPKMLPEFISVLMIALGLLVGVTALVLNSGLPPMKQEAIDIADASGDQFGFRDSNLIRIAAVIGTGVAYVVLFHAFGYFVATFLSFVLILLAFGSRNILQIMLISLVGTLIYNFLFMNLMGLYDPPGVLFNFQPLLSKIPGV